MHIYSAEWVWHVRWEGHSPTALLAVDMFPDVSALRLAWVEHEGRMRTLVTSAGEAGLVRRFEYTLLSGMPGSSTLGQVVQHVVNHATYHRGQVISLLRQMEYAVPETDLIVYFYERAGE